MRHALDCGMCCGVQVCDCGAEKPRIKPLPKTGDSTPFLVDGERVVVNITECYISGKSLFEVLKDKLDSRQPPG